MNKYVELSSLPVKMGVGKNKNKQVIDWVNSIGYEVEFTYNNTNGKIKILDYLPHNQILVFEYNGKTYRQSTSSFKKACFGYITNTLKTKYTHSIGEIVTTNSGQIEIIDFVKMNNKRTYKYKCLECGNIDFKSEYHLNNGSGCNACCKNHQKLIVGVNSIHDIATWMEDIMVDNTNAHKYTCNSCEKIKFKCKDVKYHIYESSICNVYHSKGSCPFCNPSASGRVHSRDSLGEYVKNKFGSDYLNNIWSKSNNYSPFSISIQSNKNIKWICLKHGEYERTAQNQFLADYMCPICRKEMNCSTLQHKVVLFLQKLGYSVNTEYECVLKCVNPKTKKILPYDNEVESIKLIIEVHGEQHYNKLSDTNIWLNGKTPDEYLYTRRLYDRYKRYFAKTKGYNYLEIPYWSDNKEEYWKELITNKINNLK